MVRRIAVVGSSAGGKSTLSRRLGEELGLPVHEVDLVHFRPDWSPAPDDEVEPVIDSWLERDAWIIDGLGPWPAVERRFDAADTIVWVDLPLRTHLWRMAKRHLLWHKPEGRRRPRVRMKIGTIVRLNRDDHARIEELVTDGRRQGKLIHLRTPREIEQFKAPAR